jgi:Glycosyl hydrolases family 2, sugar binding domain/Glycosyl hydrolases family 2/Glycosyl hydrolases family 2, TIM barrel domain
MATTLPYASDVAQRFELEHGWEFLPDRTGRLRYEELASVTGWRSARAGLSWNVQFEDLRDFMGAAWYRITIDVPRFDRAHHVLIRFGAVDYFCEVLVNGRIVGSHEGGYTPFSFDITSAVHTGANEIAIRVIDPPMNEAENRELFPDMMYNEIPHGKQNWYVQNSGIWQGVRLEFCPALYVDRVDLTPRIDGSFEAVVRLAGVGLTSADVRDIKLRLSIFDMSGRTVFETPIEIGDANELHVQGRITQPRLWSPEDPALYVVEARLSGAVEYRRRTRFGFRSFEARDGRLYLNGKPFYLISTLDQDFYPETIHTPASEEFVRDMMLKAKKLGINVLRCHLKVAHPVYLDIADETGMLVWTEMPSWSDCWFPCDHFSARAALRGEQMFAEVMVRDWNHPCIVIRTIMNESWGINLKQEDQRKWLLDIFERVKRTLEPLNRLVVDNSACEGNFHLKTDIEDFHQYYSMPDQVQLWDKWLNEFASRPAWTFSPYGDAERTGNEPLVVSEFGNWGLPKLPESEELPWWFHYSFGGREVTNPAGVFDRFRKFQLGSVFSDYNDFAVESQWHQYISLKYEIESMRAHNSIQGYVVTAMTDVHWEVNGLLDMWRNPKVFAEELARLQQPDVVFARTDKWTHFAGEQISLRVFVSHYSGRDLGRARVRWSTDSGASGQLTLDHTPPGSVTAAGSIEWRAPETQGPLVERVFLEVRSANGARLAENTFELFVLPQRMTEAYPPVAFHDPDGRYPELQDTLHQAGYASATLRGDALLVATKLDDSVANRLHAGGSVLLLVDSDNAFPPDASVRSTIRAGSELDGRWFSNFNWIRPDSAPFREVAFGRILGFESVNVVPNYVIEGIAGEDFADVISGVTYGWLQKNSGLAVQMAVNGGRVLATTYRFHHYGHDPYATTLLDALIRYTASSDFAPRLQFRAGAVAEK